MQSVIDFVLGVIGYFQFWVVLDPFERGLVIRLGKLKREIGPGLHFVLPLGIDDVKTEEMTVTTEHLSAQTLDTHDRCTVVAVPIVKWKIADLQPYLLTIDDAEGVLTDGVASLVARTITVTDYDDIFKEDFWHEITKSSRRAVKKYGMYIEEVGYSDLALIKTIRIMSDADRTVVLDSED